VNKLKIASRKLQAKRTAQPDMLGMRIARKDSSSQEASTPGNSAGRVDLDPGYRG